MTHKLHNFHLLVLLALFCSCEDKSLPECPPEVVVEVAVKDKNYFNINEFPQLDRVDETQPFHTFVGSLYYELSDTATGQVVRKSFLTPSAKNESTYSFSLLNLPDGEYDLAVWGNGRSGTPAGELHPGNSEYTDIYTTTRRIRIDGSASPVYLELERAKGKIVLLCRNFPASISRVEQEIAPVYQLIDAHLAYSGRTTVQKAAPFSTAAEFLSAPTPAGSGALLNVRFYSDAAAQAFASGTPELALPPTEITVRRNELTVLAIDYNLEHNYWEVWCYVNGAWEMIHHLIIY